VTARQHQQRFDIVGIAGDGLFGATPRLGDFIAPLQDNRQICQGGHISRQNLQNLAEARFRTL
jgi:hypothetical protein